MPEFQNAALSLAEEFYKTIPGKVMITRVTDLDFTFPVTALFVQVAATTRLDFNSQPA
jgi:hypothetical protein